MELLSVIFARFLYASLIAGIIIVLLLSVKKSLRNRLSGRVCHIFWLLVLIRLMIPFQIETPFSIINIFPEIPPAFNYSQEYLSSRADGYSKAETMNSNESQELDEGYYDREKTKYYSIWKSGFLSLIWLTGVTAIALFTVITSIQFKRRSRQFERVNAPQINELMSQCCVRLEIKKDIPLYQDAYFRSPCIAGIFSPKIYLPRGICSQIPPHQMEHVLLHELAHYKRKDLIYNLCRMPVPITLARHP